MWIEVTINFCSFSYKKVSNLQKVAGSHMVEIVKEWKKNRKTKHKNVKKIQNIELNKLLLYCNNWKLFITGCRYNLNHCTIN